MGEAHPHGHVDLDQGLSQSDPKSFGMPDLDSLESSDLRLVCRNMLDNRGLASRRCARQGLIGRTGWIPQLTGIFEYSERKGVSSFRTPLGACQVCYDERTTANRGEVAERLKAAVC